MLAGMVTLLFWSLVRFNCARNSGVDDVSRLHGVDVTSKPRAFEPATRGILHAMWMHHVSSTSSPLVPYLMRAPFLGQVWVLRVPR